MKNFRALFILFALTMAACATPPPITPTSVVSQAMATPSIPPSPTLGASSTPTPRPTSTPTLTPAPTATVAPSSAPTLAPLKPGDLILRFADGGYRLLRGETLQPARADDFTRFYREPSVVRVRRGDRWVDYLLEVLPERRVVRLIRPEGDGPTKEVMYSDDRYKNFLVGTVAASDWGYAVVIQSNGRESELFFGEPLGDHHQGAARQKLPPWIKTVQKVIWQGENLLLIVQTAEGKFGLVWIVPGARQRLPAELVRDAWSARHELSEPLMRYNKSLQRQYSPLWVGDEELIDLAGVR